MRDAVAAVLCAVRGPQESAVVRALSSGSLTVARRCADLGELLGVGAVVGVGGHAHAGREAPAV
ncbi:MAG TPA: hypothetical protein PKB06_08400, partial [Actinotalea sp.]|nr:hypothetical protein [Actinotalea sp.]